MNKPSSCTVCGTPIVQGAHRPKLYCSKRCNDRARWRRNANLPIADLPVTPKEAAELIEKCRKLEHENQKLRKLVNRQRQIHRKYADLAKNARTRIEEAINRQIRAEESEAAAIAFTSEIAFEHERRATSALHKCKQLEKQLDDYQELKLETAQNNNWMNQKIRQLETEAQQHRRKLSISEFTDYVFFGNYYFRTKNRSFWTQADTSRMNRFKKATGKN